ncbi:MAG: TrmH family RNA methyltransferase, partial [Prevotella sp.]|nr:TrmH family RNA methyltransferase [Prevotella sp.]
MPRKLKTIEIERISVEEFQQAEKTPLVVVLDNVRSMYNIGSVFRTADAFRIEEVLLCGITATPPSNEIHKTALGAEESVSWRYFKETIDAVAYLKQKGYVLCA